MGGRRFVIVVAVLTALLIGAAVAGLGIGAVAVDRREVLASLLPWQTPSDPTAQTIVLTLRLPRILLAILVGGSLAGAGAAYQGLFQNVLADPYIVGASSGASLGVTLAVITGLQIRLGGFDTVGLGAFGGALLAVVVVYGVAEAGGAGSPISLLLAGVAFSTMVASVVSLLMVLHSESLHKIFLWLMGSLANSGWDDVRTAATYAPPGLITLWLMSRPLDALSCGDETAMSLGLNLRRARMLIIGGASLTTAAAVSGSGTIGFIGMIAPHMARMLVGAEHGRVLPVAFMLGALILLVADTVARTLLAPLELPVGIFTSLIGGPFFLYLLGTGRWKLK